VQRERKHATNTRARSTAPDIAPRSAPLVAANLSNGNDSASRCPHPLTNDSQVAQQRVNCNRLAVAICSMRPAAADAQGNFSRFVEQHDAGGEGGGGRGA
jgi:hypothetical protein